MKILFLGRTFIATKSTKIKENENLGKLNVNSHGKS